MIEKKKQVCVFGLGYVGLTLSVILAEIGFEVIGIEKNKKFLKKLKKGKSHIYEPFIEYRLKRIIKKKRIVFLEKLSKEFASDIYIITVGTPLDDNRSCNLNMIKNVSKEIAKNIKKEDLVILRSTVKIGTTNNVVKPILDKAGVKYSMAFCPERTAEGQALKELKELPQIISSDTKSGEFLSKELFKKITKNIIYVGKIEVGEMIKLIDNVQRDVKFAFSNEVAKMCDVIGINVADVVDYGKWKYPRTNLYMPGTVGGPCLEKDTFILSEFFSKDKKPKISLTSRLLNKEIPKYSVGVIKANLLKQEIKKISICGLAFKGIPEVSDLRGSTVYQLINELKTNFPDAKIYGFDVMIKNVRKKLELNDCKNKRYAFTNADIVIIHNNHYEFSNLDLNYFSKLMKKNGLIYDFWNNYSNKKIELKNQVRYLALGNIKS